MPHMRWRLNADWALDQIFLSKWFIINDVFSHLKGRDLSLAGVYSFPLCHGRCEMLEMRCSQSSQRGLRWKLWKLKNLTDAGRRARLPVVSVFHLNAGDPRLALQFVACVTHEGHGVTRFFALAAPCAVHWCAWIPAGRRYRTWQIKQAELMLWSSLKCNITSLAKAVNQVAYFRFSNLFFDKFIHPRSGVSEGLLKPLIALHDVVI